jgi:hypothetical protein
MTEYVIGPGGVVIPKEQYKEWTNEDGGDQKPEDTKKTQYSQLGVRERAQCNDFLKKHPEFTTLNGVANEKRAHVFREQIAEELLALRAESDRRREAGETPLSLADRELIVPVQGVIRSAWRHNTVLEANNERVKANNQMYNEALGITGQDR